MEMPQDFYTIDSKIRRNYLKKGLITIESIIL